MKQDFVSVKQSNVGWITGRFWQYIMPSMKYKLGKPDEGQDAIPDAILPHNFR